MKDLTELAARRRTYVVRTVYAILLFAAFALFFMAEISRRGLHYNLLGAGKDLLEGVTIMQLVGVYLFLPAMVAPAIAGEKERGTLALLFTTDLGPWEILIQKYLSRLAPMFMFLLLSLPLMAVAYSLGGFSSQRLLLSAYVIFTTCMQLAAFALMFSAFCRNTTETMGAIYSGAMLLFVATVLIIIVTRSGVGRTSGQELAQLTVGGLAPALLLVIWRGGSTIRLIVGALPWAWTVAFMLLAKHFLVTRAFKRKTVSIQKTLRDFGRVAGSRIVGVFKPHTPGRRTRKSKTDLPGDKPIVWRELSQSSLKTWRGILLSALLVGVPVIVMALLIESRMGPYNRGNGFSLAVWAIWLMSALSIVARSVSAFGLERANQTLELLITTPLSGREIVQQKASAIRRRGLLALVQLGTLFVIFSAFMIRYTNYSDHGWRGVPDLGTISYLFVSFMSALIYLTMAGWVAGWIGLRLRKQAHSTGIAFGAIFGICVVPFLVGIAVSALTGIRLGRGPEWIFTLSPAMIICFTELAKSSRAFHSGFHSPAAWPVFISWIVAIGIAAVFRSLCLNNADKYLGRSVSSGDPE
jgi:ABC-type transport system involved in multi-copper enzyme maturation permease subunit